MALELGLTNRSLQRILKEDIAFKPYKKCKRHGLTDAQKKKRLVRSCELLRGHASGDLDGLVFSDEKLFSVEEKLNSQNTRIYAFSVEDIPEEIRTVQRFQKEDKVMIWAGISKIGKFPLVFIESGVRINAHYYIENVLKPVVKVHGERMYPNRNWTFQQDSAPAHKAKITQAWCRSNLSNFISTSEWPPCSPDLNPMDYSIWGILEARVNAKRHKSIEALRATLTREWEKLSMENVRAAIDAWPKRLKGVRKAKGGHIE